MTDEPFGSADDYKRAFEALRREGFSPKDVPLLQAHFDAPSHTATWAQLADRVGYASGRAVNLHYGRLAGRVAHELRITDPPNGFWLSVLAGWAEEADPGGHTAFVLRRPVIEALVSLGIFRNSPETFETLEIVEQDFEREVEKALALSQQERRGHLTQYPKYPSKVSAVTTIFRRNPYVVAEVLIRARGICESCHARAPFFRLSDGTPYLEVHHRIRLADGGEDTVENAVALCPNCHREAHYG